MLDVSTDLLFVLLFALIFLGQYVMQRIRASRQQQQDTPRELPQESEEQAPGVQWGWDVPLAAPAAAPVAPAMLAPEHRIERWAAPAMRRRQRFSRDSLMGDRRKLQDAVVIAAIVGPCRAVEPHDIRQ